MKTLSVVVLATLLLAVTGFANLLAAAPPAYERVASRFQLPPLVLYGVALTESGMRTDQGMRPWPWTLNVEGKAERFDDRQQAIARLQQLLAQGRSNIDVGLMQVNWHYHGQRFKDANDALDPYRNLEVGAAILIESWQRTGNLWDAIGRYHSATPDRAQGYQQRVAQRLVQQLAVIEP